MRVNPVSSTEQLNLDFGDAQSRQERESKPRDPGKAATIKISDEAVTEREAQKNLDKIKTNKAKAEIADIAAKEKANKVDANEYKKYPASIRPAGGSGGGGSSQNLLQKMNPLSKPYKAGGKVKSASARADGCCVRGKTRA
jgi:hypothetical protein